jgi:hypothetical protein
MLSETGIHVEKCKDAARYERKKIGEKMERRCLKKSWRKKSQRLYTINTVQVDTQYKLRRKVLGTKIDPFLRVLIVTAPIVRSSMAQSHSQRKDP